MVNTKHGVARINDGLEEAKLQFGWCPHRNPKTGVHIQHSNTLGIFGWSEHIKRESHSIFVAIDNVGCNFDLFKRDGLGKRRTMLGLFLRRSFWQILLLICWEWLSHGTSYNPKAKHR